MGADRPRVGASRVLDNGAVFLAKEAGTTPAVSISLAHEPGPRAIRRVPKE